ncbi:MAG: GNAT family N-acetyltransferase, partial [Candidatus Bathyarchaeia archaeon]
MKLDIKPYMPGDEEGIVSLLNDVFKDWPKQDIEVPPVEYWKWKYLENPLKRMLVVTAQDEGIIIGCHHDIPLRINVEGEIWNCSYTADLAVDEKYRGEGVSTMMRSYKEEKVKTKEKLSYFITSNLDLIEKFSKIFHQFPVKIVNYVYINDINTHLRKRPVNNPYLVRVGFKLFRSLGKLRTKMVDYSGNGIGDVK